MKKLLSVLLVITLLTLPTVVLGEAEAEGKTVVYDEAQVTLFKLGILDEETYDGDAKVTRGEFINKVIKMTGVESIPLPSDNKFSDVTGEHTYAASISMACDMGIISGYSDGTFRPDETLTKEQAVKILMTLLGYEDYALSYGGYPGGYLTIAAVEGVLKKIPVGDFTECTWKSAARLIYNALHTDILQVESYPEKKYFSRENENPMTLWMGVFLHEGTVSANSTTSLNQPRGVREGTVKIDDIQYYENGTDASSFIGYPIRAYYKKDMGDNRGLVSVQPLNKIKEAYSNAENISDATNETDFSWYDENGVTQNHFPIAGGATVIYNGKYYEKPLTKELLKPKMGSVKVLDTTYDGIADIVFIENVKVYFLKSSPQGGKIVDTYDNETIIIDLDDPAVKINVIKDGEAYEYEKIKKNDVLTISESDDGTLYNITVSRERLKGILLARDEDTLTIDEYQLKMVQSNKAYLSSLKLGEKITFYLTADDRIAGYGNISQGGYEYGYLIIGSVSLEGIDSEKNAQVRIFKLNDTVESYALSEDIMLDGERYGTDGKYTPGSVLKKLAVITPGTPKAGDKNQTIFCNQLIKFKLNDEGEIADILLPADNTVENGGTGEYIEEFSFDYSDTINGVAYMDVGFLDGIYTVTGGTRIKIPSDQQWSKFYSGEVSVDDIEKQIYTFIGGWVQSSNAGGNKEKYLPLLDVYDVTEDRACTIMIQKARDGQVTTTEPYDIPTQEFFLVEKLTTTLDEDGMEVKKLYGCYMGAYGEYVLDVESIIGAQEYMENPYASQILSIEPGDVLRIATNTFGEITNIIKIFTMDKARNGYFLNASEFDDWKNHGYNVSLKESINYIHNSSISAWGGSYHNAIHCRYKGKVTGEFGTTVTIDLGTPKDAGKPMSERLLFIANSGGETFISVYDEETKTVRNGSVSDIKTDDPYQTIVVRNRCYTARDTIIINRKKSSGEIYWVGPYNN